MDTERNNPNGYKTQIPDKLSGGKSLSLSVCEYLVEVPGWLTIINFRLYVARFFTTIIILSFDDWSRNFFPKNRAIQYQSQVTSVTHPSI